MRFSYFRSALSKSAGLYTFSNSINAAIPFFLLPILTRYMSPQDYGIVAMFAVLINFLSPFIGLNIHGAIQRQFYERDRINYAIYIANCLFILLISSLIVAFIVFILKKQFTEISKFPREWLWIVVIFSMCQFINLIVLSIWQVQVKPVQYSVFQISQSLLNAGFSIWFIVYLGLTWRGRILANTIAVVIFAIFSVIVITKNQWAKYLIDKSYLKNALKFGIPLVPHALGAAVMTITDRIFITNMVGLRATGLYSVGYQIGMIIGIIGNSFNQAYVPWLYEKLKQNDYAMKVKIVKFTYLYFILIILFAVSLAIIAPLGLRIMVGKEFSSSLIFVIWIALGYAFNGMYKMIVNFIFFAEKTYILAWITFLCALSNVFFNYVLIKANGAVGAAQAVMITFFLMFILTWPLSNKVYPMPWFKINIFSRKSHIMR